MQGLARHVGSHSPRSRTMNFPLKPYGLLGLAIWPFQASHYPCSYCTGAWSFPLRAKSCQSVARRYVEKGRCCVRNAIACWCSDHHPRACWIVCRPCSPSIRSSANPASIGSARSQVSRSVAKTLGYPSESRYASNGEKGVGKEPSPTCRQVAVRSSPNDGSNRGCSCVFTCPRVRMSPLTARRSSLSLCDRSTVIGSGCSFWHLRGRNNVS